MVEVVLKRLLPPISRRNKRFLLHKRQTRVALENGSPITTACRPLNCVVVEAQTTGLRIEALNKCTTRASREPYLVVTRKHLHLFLVAH
jgi:hypothetical protein